ncbi:ComEC/Rec2 family competence protein [Altibacter sp. HG106]|uniref:ComEC/Rec2 family competence protein n=1 Tax=Altibacter sp. HG106 TaxID=3023937 RepID=UPI0023510091|nr:ComEC/Rec2 family competence protein [Altibacter sp. HG106]MDC7994273.1 ComEC/Rec2 family competence protein [Altibacter sp. HG106]
MFFLKYPLTQPILAFAFGILWAHYVPIAYPVWPYAIILLLILTSEWQRTKQRFARSRSFYPILLLLFILLGYLNYQWHQPEYQPYHYLQQSTVGNRSEVFQVKIIESLKKNPFQERYVVRCVGLNGAKCSGKLLLQKAIDTVNHAWTIDDVILLKTRLQPLPFPRNPGAFNYAAYLQNQSIYALLAPSSEELVLQTAGNNTLKGQANAFRAHLISKLSQSGIPPRERAIIQALVLGEKRAISPTLYSGYADAGALHILAVSGLHVGILFLLFSSILRPLKYLYYGTYIRSVLLVLLLWGFAFMTGLSPSVVRAVVMFTLFAIAQWFGRNTNTLMILFLAFFLMLVHQPKHLFNVGFQMSYLAVFFIVFGQPIVARSLRPRNTVVRKAWAFITVTLTAQLGVMPISLFYFHTFPGLFLVTNIVVLPLISLLLIAGLLSVLWSAIIPLPPTIAQAVTFLFEQLNNFILWVARQETFIFRNIAFSRWEALSLYAMTISGLLLIQRFSVKKALQFGTFVAVLLGSVGILSYHTSRQSEWLVFHKYKASLFGFRSGNKLRYMYSDSLTTSSRNSLLDYRVANRVSTEAAVTLQHYFEVAGKRVLLVDSLAQYALQAPVDIVILTESPKLHLDRLIERLHPELIIADGSNYPSYVKRWQGTCIRKQIRFHDTRAQGVFRSE